MISVSGGVIGIISGITINGIIALIMTMMGSSLSMIISIKSIIVAFFVCSLTGIFFGWYPAKKASNLNPIDALRYE